MYSIFLSPEPRKEMHQWESRILLVYRADAGDCPSPPFPSLWPGKLNSALGVVSYKWQALWRWLCSSLTVIIAFTGHRGWGTTSSDLGWQCNSVNHVVFPLVFSEMLWGEIEYYLWVPWIKKTVHFWYLMRASNWDDSMPLARVIRNKDLSIMLPSKGEDI